MLILYPRSVTYTTVLIFAVHNIYWTEALFLQSHSGLIFCWLHHWFINWDKSTYMNCVYVCLYTCIYIYERAGERERKKDQREREHFPFTCFLWQQYFQYWGFSREPIPYPPGFPVCIHKPGSWSTHHPAVSAAHNLSDISQCTGHHGSGDCWNSWEKHSPQSIPDSPWLHRQNAHSWGGRNKKVNWGFLTRHFYSS